jgi:hypothetical protein
MSSKGIWFDLLCYVRKVRRHPRGRSCAGAPLWNQTKSSGRITDDVSKNPLIQFLWETLGQKTRSRWATYPAAKSPFRKWWMSARSGRLLRQCAAMEPDQTLWQDCGRCPNQSTDSIFYGKRSYRRRETDLPCNKISNKVDKNIISPWNTLSQAFPCTYW